MIWAACLASLLAPLVVAQGDAGAPAPPAPGDVDLAHAAPDGTGRESALMCAVDEQARDAALECVTMNGEHRTFDVAESGAAGKREPGDATLGTPVNVGFLSDPGPALLTSGVIVVAAGIATTVILRTRRPEPAAAARQFLLSLPKRSAAPLVPGPPRLAELVERANANPLDGHAQFELSMELFARNEHDVALRALERAIHLTPEVILPLLQQPEYADYRERNEVRAMLHQVWRERERRLAGYV